MELKRNTILQNGRYIISSTLGQGGFGITYKATQNGLGREVAIKEFYMPNISFRDEKTSSITLASEKSKDLWYGFKNKFIKEARTLALLNHPNIVKIFDVFEENGTAYYAMEFIPGGSLKQLVKTEGPLTEERAIDTINKIGLALDYIHSHNILHLDIKPDNIMMKEEKEPIIIDFGISKRYDESGSQTSTMQTGRSKGYAPLEQYKQGGLDTFTPATDVYSLAATLYYLLGANRPPEPSDIYDSGLPLLLDISSDTMGAIMKGMAVRKAERPQRVNEFISLLPSFNEKTDNDFSLNNHRTLIQSLELDKNYKEAYNRCLEAIERGNDVEFSKKKATELISKMKKKNRIQSTAAVIIAIAVTILITIISILI